MALPIINAAGAGTDQKGKPKSLSPSVGVVFAKGSAAADKELTLFEDGPFMRAYLVYKAPRLLAGAYCSGGVKCSAEVAVQPFGALQGCVDVCTPNFFVEDRDICAQACVSFAPGIDMSMVQFDRSSGFRLRPGISGFIGSVFVDFYTRAGGNWESSVFYRSLYEANVSRDSREALKRGDYESFYFNHLYDDVFMNPLR
jgi:hypothetical protein